MKQGLGSGVNSYLLIASLIAATLLLVPMRSDAAWRAELRGGVGLGEQTPFVKTQVEYDFQLGDWHLAPGVNAGVAGYALEFNGSLRGTYFLNRLFTLHFGMERGLGSAGDIYCHQSWHLGAGTHFGQTDLALFLGGRSRTVWHCSNAFDQYLGLQLTHGVSGRPEIGIRIGWPLDNMAPGSDLELALGWRF